MTDLTNDQAQSVKRSYLNILGFFLQDEKLETRYLRCLLKWGFQLRLTPEDLKEANVDISEIQFAHPEQKAERLQSLYHLVYMIYLDRVVEDIELEVATLYAQRLGFDKPIVSELFKSIATADYDQSTPRDVQKEVMDFMKVYYA